MMLTDDIFQNFKISFYDYKHPIIFVYEVFHNYICVFRMLPVQYSKSAVQETQEDVYGT